MLLSKVEPLVPDVKFKVTKVLASEIANKMDEDPAVIIKYLYAISSNRNS